MTPDKTTPSYDVAVVGGGPAGAVAATLLTRRGLSVALMDRPAATLHKIGESLPASGEMFLKKFNLPLASQGGRALPIRGAMTLWAGQRTEQSFLASSSGPSWRLDRLAFDQSLRDQAQRDGVTLFSETCVAMERTTTTNTNTGTNTNTSGTGWHLGLPSGHAIRAGRVVDASGRIAAVARSQGHRPVKRTPLCVVWALGTPIPGDAPLPSQTLIESQQQGWWYGCILPSRCPLAAFHCSPETAAALVNSPKLWQQTLAKAELLAEVLDPAAFAEARPTRMVLSTNHLETPYGEGWIACGDAALAFDPLSSQGIFNALAGAEMTAQALEAETEGALRTYADRLTEIRNIYDRRRQGLYLQGLARYQSAFWRSMVEEG